MTKPYLFKFTYITTVTGGLPAAAAIFLTNTNTQATLRSLLTLAYIYTISFMRT